MKRNLFGMLTTLTLALLISVPPSAQTIAKGNGSVRLYGRTGSPASRHVRDQSSRASCDLNQGR